MTFLEQLQAHKGSLIQLKTQLYWYGVGYDKNPGRVCLILGAATAATAAAAATPVAAFTFPPTDAAAAHLLIDGQPAWIWVTEQDVELL